jgi:endoglucanase
MMERIIPSSMTGTVNQTYAQGLQTYVNYITSKGAYAIIDPHNFGRYYGNVITDYSGFQAFVRPPQHETWRGHTNSL